MKLGRQCISVIQHSRQDAKDRTCCHLREKKAQKTSVSAMLVMQILQSLPCRERTEAHQQQELITRASLCQMLCLICSE